MRVALFAGAVAVLLCSLSLLLPAVIAFATGEPLVARMLVYVALGTFASGSMLVALAGRVRRPGTMELLIVNLTVWSVLPLAAALPLADLAGLSYGDALFEATSGLTTTGASLLDDVDLVPRSVVVLRSLLHWIGGLLALFTVLVVLAPLGLGGLSAQTLPRRSARATLGDVGRSLDLLGRVATGYGVFTFVVFLLFLFAGVAPLVALNLSMTAVSSGGFLPFDGALLDVVGPAGMLVFTLALLVAATSIFWHRMVLSWQVARLRRHRESYLVLLVTLALAVLLYLALNRLSGPGARWSNVTESVFNAASLVSTSGIESRPGVFTLVTLPVVLFVMLAGASAYSTSGGLKLYRLGGMLVQSGQELHRLVYPSGVLPTRFGSQSFDMTLIRAIWSFLVAAVITIAVGAVIVSRSSVTFDAALVATVAAFSGAGPVYEAGWAPPGSPAWPGWEGFDALSKLTLCGVMVLGRVEVLAVVALFSLRYWRSRS